MTLDKPSISYFPFTNYNSEPSEKFIAFTISGNKSEFKITITGNDFNTFIKEISFHSIRNHKKEKLLYQAFNNLIKKNEVLQLSLQLSNNIIDEEEYRNVINENKDKYVIKANILADKVDVLVISDILQKVDKKDFTVDEVADIFSVDSKSINEKLEELKQ